MRWILRGFLLIAVFVCVLWVFGPREPAVTDVEFDESLLAGGVDAFFAAQEARFDDITPGVQKQVVWAGAPEAKTPLALVYLHGFSATAQEVRPLPDQVAQALGANLVFTRLKGHGRGGDAMAEASVEDWMTDVAEALAAGRAVGERVVIMGTSTGGTLAALALHEPMVEAVAGAVMIAPNFRVANPAAALLTWPAARWWLPLLAGRERSFEPLNDGQARYWTTRYPSAAVFPMAASVKAAGALPHGDVTVPALFVFDDADRVVDHTATRAIASEWGAKADLHVVTVGPGDDPFAHVIAGDILSPGMTEALAGVITDWVSTLP